MYYSGNQSNLWAIAVLCVLAALFSTPAWSQDALPKDSTTNRRLPAGHSPGKTLTRALLVPGWGQIYNRQFFKASIYYAGLAGGAYLVANANQNYLLYRHAALYAEYKDVPATERPDAYRDRFVDDYNEVLISRGSVPEGDLTEDEQISQRAALAPVLRSDRDRLRRNRDLNILLTFAIWSLGVIESFVSAHLLHFDVDEDLTLQVFPHPHAVTASLSITF